MSGTDYTFFPRAIEIEEKQLKKRKVHGHPERSQGIGKTTWMLTLCPPELNDYIFSGTINPNNKDTLIYLAECLFINMDELENMNRSEIGVFKEIITKSAIRMRRAYCHNIEAFTFPVLIIPKPALPLVLPIKSTHTIIKDGRVGKIVKRLETI